MAKDEDKRFNALGQEVTEGEDGRFYPVDAEDGVSAEAFFLEEHAKEYAAAEKAAAKAAEDDK
jgi:hypothetical protein